MVLLFCKYIKTVPDKPVVHLNATLLPLIKAGEL